VKIVVIGGSGRVGSKVVHQLVAQGHEAVPASPATGVDAITGEGLADVMVGADVVVDVANAPVWDDDPVRDFFTTSTRNLLAAERDAGVRHHLALATGRPSVNGRVELGGPEALGMDAWARRLFAAFGDERTVVSDPHAVYFGTELTGGELTPGEGARIGSTDFDAWLATQPQGVR
jgi:uncharacterized protein YbjT (DUF2867 family)